MPALPLALALLCATAEAGPPPVDADPGYSLDDAWRTAWLRLEDRSGRPDPEGPVQQRFEGNPYPNQQLDETQPEFPMAFERAWTEKRNGMRFWAESINEFTFGHVLEAKAGAALGEQGFADFRIDRRQLLEQQTTLARLQVGLQRLGGTGFWAGFELQPRWEKDDIDIALLAGHRGAWGEARLRVVALDAFSNASYALADYRGDYLDMHRWQLDVPLGVDASLRTQERLGLRAELYAGAQLRSRVRYRFESTPEDDRVQTQSGLLGGGLVEYRPLPPFAAGLALLAEDTRTAYAWDSRPQDDRTLDERTFTARLYALAHLPGNVRLEGSVRRALRPEWVDYPADASRSTRRDDREWLYDVQAHWMPLPFLGGSLTLMRDVRRASGPPEVQVQATNDRLVTRLTLKLGERLWATFGTGWDLDPGEVIYDGSGATILLDW